MPQTVVKIGPQDHGLCMPLEEFEHAEVAEGFLYELSRGVITVSDVPNRKHMAMVQAIREQWVVYKVAHKGMIFGILSGSECKILLGDMESTRRGRQVFT